MGEGRMRKREGQDLVGRFIKASNSKILEKVSLHSFDFKEINQTPVVAMDNVSGCIVMPDLHEKEDLQRVIKEHQSINLEIRSKETIRPVLRPMDFTTEWAQWKDRLNKKRDMKMEDDDDDEFEMALAMQEQDEVGGGSYTSETNETTESVEQPDETGSVAETSDHEGDDANPFKFKSEEQEAGPQNDHEMDGVADQINQLGNQDESIDELSSDVRKAPAQEQEFIPVDMTGGESFDQVENEAAAQYKVQQQEQEIKNQYAEQLEAAFEEAKAKGYEDGFQVGEEKASIQVQQNATEVIDNLAGVVNELEKLKKNILDNTQENFYEVCQAVAESLLRREFSLNPGSFADVLRRAINDSIQDDEIKIAVHSDTYNRLMEIEVQDLKDKLVKDDQLKPGDFRIDSNLSVVDGNIREMISDLMEQADLTLFEDKDDKVG